MKKLCVFTVITVFCVGLLTNNVFAQKPYVKAGLGYNFVAGSWTDANRTETNTNSTTGPSVYKSTTEGVNFSLGKGIGFGIAPGFMFNKNVGAELGINYLMGMKNETTNKSTNTSSTTTTTSTSINSVKGSLLSFIPSIVIESGLDKINPYAKFGIIIGLPSFVSESDNTQPTSTGTTTKDVKTLTTTKSSGGIALGYNAALGINYNISDKMGIFGELNLNSLSYAASKSVITKKSVDGADKLADLKTKDKETVYEDPHTSDSSTPVSDSEPRKSSKYKLPFGSFGINVGIKIGF